MFALEIEYLMGRAYAGSSDNRQLPEWPPPPSRLHSAAVAAYHQAVLGEEVRQALLWLEQQPPPAIAAGDSAPRVESGTARYGAPKAPTAYVPHNYPRQQSGRQILPEIRQSQGKIGRHFPSVSLERDRLHFIWPSAPPEPLKQALQVLVEHIGYLGTSSSKVRVAVCDSPPEPEFRPCSDDDANGEFVLSTPYAGRLAALERAYKANRQAPPGRPVYYARVSPAPSGPTQSEFDKLYVLRALGRSALPARYTVAYTSVFRNALLQLGDKSGLNLAAIHGHEDVPHCAFLALPHTGHPHAESMIKAFAIAFPSGIDREYRAGIRQLAGRIALLTFGRYGECSVAPLGDASAPRTANPETWIGPSRSWTSVTPLLLDRFPKDNAGDTIADIVSASCARIGLPTPLSIEFGEYSPEPGVQPVREFCLRRKTEDQPRLARHVTLEFAANVRGPVLLGAGRYFGLGLFKPLRRSEDRS